jgi:hypothetical protein
VIRGSPSVLRAGPALRYLEVQGTVLEMSEAGASLKEALRS